MEELTVEVLEIIDHDTGAFTQGLVADDKAIYESAGGYGKSDLRVIDLDTGAIQRIVDLPDDVFAEGLALIDDELIQLTWREGIALRWRASDMTLLGTFAYTGQGWGLCYDGTALWMSDGSSTLVRRDPTTFEIMSSIIVTHDGQAVERLNELECRTGDIYANVWFARHIVRIDPITGDVTGTIDASELLPTSQPAARDAEAVLNGIAELSDGTLLLTGKRWPVMYRVQIIPAR